MFATFTDWEFEDIDGAQETARGMWRLSIWFSSWFAFALVLWLIHRRRMLMLRPM